MSGAGYVHGGTDAREVARLEKQADFTAARSLVGLSAPPGARVLDLATGVGAMAARLRARLPGIHLVGVDLSAAQLAAARRNHPETPYVRSDGVRLPFPDGAFDVVHWSWLLEHLVDPRPVLREARRVLAPGGRCHFIEVDNATFGTTPVFDEVAAVMRALNAAQARSGDPYVGQRLHHLLRTAGFRRFTVEPLPLRGDAADPAFFQACIDEFAEIFDGLDESLPGDFLPTVRVAAAQLRSLATRPGGALRYTARIATAWR